MRERIKDPQLCEFNKVELSIPRLKLLKCYFKKGTISYDEMIFLRGLIWKCESANNKLLHIISIAEKSLRKSLARGT